VTCDRLFSPDSPVSFINKTERHDIADISLKVALNTIILTVLINVRFELTTLVVIMVIVCKHVLVMNTDYIMISLQSGSNCNATDALIEAGIAHPSAVPDFTPGFQWGSRCSILSFLCCAL
jgi:hypothetical protein